MQLVSECCPHASKQLLHSEGFGDVVTRKKSAPPDADDFVNVPDKFAKYFSPNPGEGD